MSRLKRTQHKNSLLSGQQLLQHVYFVIFKQTSIQNMKTWANPEGGKGIRPHPLKNHKNIGFLSNTGPDPLKYNKATEPAFNGWAIIGTPAKRLLNGVLLAGR